MRLRSGSKQPRAFTLVEILIVILIIGMLLAIASPGFMKARQGSHARACQHNLMQILGAKERWAMDYSQGPTAAPDMTDLVSVTRYIKNTPLCPAGGDYTIGRLDQLPSCSVGGVQGTYNAHVLP